MPLRIRAFGALLASSTNGVTNAVAGMVERYGRFWVENAPLDAGTNWLALTAVDVWGNAESTNIQVIQSDVALEVSEIPRNALDYQAPETITPQTRSFELGV